jgi:hypothetical protein
MLENVLVKTKGVFKIAGIITGKDTPSEYNGYKEGKIDKEGKMKGKHYKSIRFLVKTSNNNSIPVEVFGIEKDSAYLYNKTSGKSAPVEWSKRHNKYEGCELILPDYDLAELINKEFKDGDKVFLLGEFKFDVYNEKTTTKFIIKKINKSSKEIDIDGPEFKEYNTFDYEIVIDSMEKVKEENKLLVNAFIITASDNAEKGYRGRFELGTFEIDANKDPLFANTFYKNLKFGDLIKVKGKIHNRAFREVAQTEWGLQEVSDFKKCLEIIGADVSTLKQKMYKESDFVVEENSVDATATWASIEKKITNDDDLPFPLDD